MGRGEGKGTTLNIPLEVGSGDDEYKHTFDQLIIPKLRSFQPQLIMVSVGFDAHQLDPLGGMRVTTDGYRWMARTLRYMSKDFCDGRLMMILEGGYDLRALRESAEEMLEELVSD